MQPQEGQMCVIRRARNDGPGCADGKPQPAPDPTATESLNAQRTTHTYTHTPKGDKVVPCARCWRLELPCRPYLRAAGGGAGPRELMSATEEVAERVLGCTDLGALAEQMVGAFRLGEVDPTRAGALL